MTQDWRITSTVGGKFTKVKPVFSTSRQYFLVLTSLELRVYLFSSKQCVRSVPIQEAESVTDIHTVHENEHFVWIARRDGQCELVNWMDREFKETVDLDIPLVRLLQVSKSKYTAVVEGKNKHGYAIVERNMDSGNLKHLANCKNGRLCAVSSNRQYYAFYSSHKKDDLLIVGKIGTSNSSKSFRRTHGLTALAVSDDGTVAAGSQTGVIDLYYTPFEESGPKIRALKWHVDSVLSLWFSDNNYLLSGGKEKVLVFWQLETDNTQFLPRLDGEIRDIIGDSTSELYALSLGDDQVLVISAVDLVSRLQVSGLKAQFTRLPNDPERERRRRKKLGEPVTERMGDFTSLYAIHPKTKSMYLPTAQSSQLQIYDIQKDDQTQVISVASTVQTGKVKQEELIEEAKVMHISFTKDGTWMATVDEKVSPPVDRLMSKDDKSIELKFWSLDNKTGKWALATRVSSPHGNNKSILDIIPQIGGHGFITAAEDGGVRLWKPSAPGAKEGINAGVGADGRTIAWGVRKVLPPTGTTSSAVALALSPDSSVLFLGFETSIYAIDAAKFEVYRPLPNILGGRVRRLSFGSTGSLVCLSKTRLVVWDLINDVAKWSIAVGSPQGGRRLLGVDAQNGRFAVGVNHYDTEFRTIGKVFVFSVESPLPLHVEYHSNAISGVSWVPGTSNFLFMDTNGRVSTLSTGSAAFKKGQQKHRSDEVLSDMSHLYQIKHKQQEVSVGDGKKNDSDEELPDGQSRVLNINSFDNVFDGQSEYSLDSLESLFDKVMGVLS